MKIPPFKLERYFAQYEFHAPHLLGCSDCESMTIQDLLQYTNSDLHALSDVWLGYIDSNGTPPLRQAISQLYSRISPDQICSLAGAEEGIFLFFTSLLSPGDHVIIQTPAYQSLVEIPRALGLQISLWSMEFNEKQWILDLKILESLITPKTRALVINFPHSPTGTILSRKAFDTLIRIAQDHELILFSDEVYRFLELQPEWQLPAVCDVYDNGISLGVMSKAFGLPGLRVGWIATRNEGFLNAFFQQKDYTTICNAAPSEFLATLALQHKDVLLARNLAIVKQNHKLFSQFVKESTPLFSWVPSQGSSVGFVRLNLETTTDTFCADLVKEAGILLIPGQLFDYGTHFFRIGFGRKNFRDIFSLFTAYCAQKHWLS